MPRVRGSVESYDAERADFERVLAAIQRAQDASLDQLRDFTWVNDYVSSVGLANLDPPEETYADQVHLMNASHQGIGQYPLEFARWLHLLSGESVQSYLEIGCFNGNTACLAAAYLHRFQPSFRLVTLDLWPWFLFEPLVRGLIPVDYRMRTTSFDVREQQFDAVFIDGDHTFEWAWADYQNVGRRARICGMHDVASTHYLESYAMGGVTTAWEVIRRDEGGPGVEFLEFRDHPVGDRFGIGVRLKKRASLG